MWEYHKTIDELLQEFEDFQISKITKQVNVIKTSEPTDSSASNNPGWVTFEQGETSISTEEFERKHKKIYTSKYREWQIHRPISEWIYSKRPYYWRPYSSMGKYTKHRLCHI